MFCVKIKNMENNHKKPGVGVGVMILQNRKVLLGRRHDDPQKADSQLHGEGTWTMPGGKLDFQESLRGAAEREVFEEIGLKIDKNKLQFISLSNDSVKDAHFVTIGFLYGEPLTAEPKVMEPDEIVEWQWFDLDDLPKNIFFPSKKILNNFINKELFNE